MSTVKQDTLSCLEKPLLEEYCAIVKKLNHYEEWLIPSSVRDPQLHHFAEEIKLEHVTLLNTALKFLSEHQLPDWKAFAENVLVQIRKDKTNMDLFSFLNRSRPWLAPFIAYLHNVRPDSIEHATHCKRWQEDHNLLLLDRVMWHLTATSPALSVPGIDLLTASRLVVTCATTLGREALAQWAAYRGYMDVIVALCVETALPIRCTDTQRRTLVHFACHARPQDSLEANRLGDTGGRLLTTALFAKDALREMLATLPSSSPSNSHVRPLEKLLREKLAWELTPCDERAILLTPDLNASLNIACTFTGTAPVQLLHVSEQQASQLFQLYLREANLGNGSAINNLGWCHHFGIGTKKDLGQALTAYKDAIEAGCVTARNNEVIWQLMHYAFDKEKQAEFVKVFEEIMKQSSPGYHRHTAAFNLARCYELGIGVETDLKKGFDLIFEASRQGYFGAQYRLGWYFENGHQVAKDAAEAVNWYRRAADQGLALAQCNLGICYKYGRGIKQDDAAAVQWYKKAAEQGLADAQYNLALMYEHARGVAQDNKMSVELYSKAAEQGHIKALYNLGMCYEYGRGVPKDEKKAVELLQQAANKGFMDAYFNLGVCYAYGLGVAKDLRRAAECYQIAANNGLAVAQYNLALCYVEGNGVPKDEKRAAELFQQAAGKGLLEAHCDLGICYEYGRGVAKDLKKAVECYQIAANNGLAAAQCNLAFCFDEGIGVPEDKKIAFDWYLQSAMGNDPRAQYQLAVCYERGKGVDADAKRAAHYHEAAAKNGHGDAMYSLGVCYQEGSGVKKDMEKAIQWLEKSAAEGCAAAMLQLAFIYKSNKEKQEPYLIEGTALYQRETGGKVEQLEDIQRYVETSTEMLPYYSTLWRIYVANKGNVGAETMLTLFHRMADLVQSSKNKIEAGAMDWQPKFANPMGMLQLEELDIDSVEMGTGPAEGLCSVLEQGLPRYRLRITGAWTRTPEVSERLFTSLVKVKASFLALELPNARLTKTATDSLCAWLKLDKERKDKEGRDDARLAVLDLDGSLDENLSEEDSSKNVLEALLGHSWLQFLSLASCHFKSLEATKALAALIATNGKLRTLNVTSCELTQKSTKEGTEKEVKEITQEAANILANALRLNAKMAADSFAKHAKETAENLAERAKETVEWFGNNVVGLHNLNLTDCKLGFEAQQRISEALSEHPAMRELNVQGNMFDAVLTENLLRMPRLAVLHADMARLASPTFIKLMSEHRTLLEIKMNNECLCFGDCRCHASLVTILRANTSLRSFYNRTWSINPYCVGDLQNVLTNNKTLTDLEPHSDVDMEEEQFATRQAAWVPVSSLLVRNAKIERRITTNWVHVAATAAFMRANADIPLSRTTNGIKTLLLTISQFHGVISNLSTISQFRGVISNAVIPIDHFLNSRWFRNVCGGVGPSSTSVTRVQLGNFEDAAFQLAACYDKGVDADATIGAAAAPNIPLLFLGRREAVAVPFDAPLVSADGLSIVAAPGYTRKRKLNTTLAATDTAAGAGGTAPGRAP